ncbi:MAG: hypothetical protein ACOZBL_02115 [Patescibacteria group bacterium]
MYSLDIFSKIISSVRFSPYTIHSGVRNPSCQAGPEDNVFHHKLGSTLSCVQENASVTLETAQVNQAQNQATASVTQCFFSKILLDINSCSS